MNRANRWLFACCFFLGAAGGVKADFIPAVTFTSGPPFPFAAEATAGYAFTVGSSNVIVTALGLEVESFNNGFAGATVRIYQDGTTTNLALANIVSTDPLSTTDNRFRYQTIGGAAGSVILTSGVKYVIVADFSRIQFAIGPGAGVTSVPGITFNNSVSAINLGEFPTNTDPFGNGPYFGPAFEIRSVTVPEPSSLLLGSLAAVGLALGTWRTRRAAKIVCDEDAHGEQQSIR